MLTNTQMYPLPISIPFLGHSLLHFQFPAKLCFTLSQKVYRMNLLRSCKTNLFHLWIVLSLLVVRFPTVRLLFVFKNCNKKLSTNLLQNDLQRVQPLEVGESKDEVDDGGGDDKNGQQPPQPGQQGEGLIFFGEGPNVVAEG